jgi:hypothetical protein
VTALVGFVTPSRGVRCLTKGEEKEEGKRLCQNAKPKDLKLLKRTTLIFQPVPRNGIPPAVKAVGLLPDSK